MGEDVQPAKIDETRSLSTDEEGKAVEGAASEDASEGGEPDDGDAGEAA